MSAKYIHYGHSEYHPEFVDVNTRRSYPLRCKPESGVWGSREDARYGWIDWCRAQAWDDEEEFGFGNFVSSFSFELTDDANILEIHCEDDILPYVNSSDGIKWRGCKTSSMDGIDFEKIRSRGYNGLELFMSDDYSMHDGVFNVWDCDSIVVWNPKVITNVVNDVRPEMWQGLDNTIYNAMCNGCNNYVELPSIVVSVYTYMIKRKENYTPEMALSYTLSILDKNTGQSFQDSIQDYQICEIIQYVMNHEEVQA